MPNCWLKKPKNLEISSLKSFVKKISGSKTKDLFFFSIIFLILLKYTIVFPEPVVPCNWRTSKFSPNFQKI